MFRRYSDPEKMIELQERVMSRQAKEQFDSAMLNFQVEKPKGKTHVSGSVLVSDKDPNQFYVMLELQNIQEFRCLNRQYY